MALLSATGFAAQQAGQRDQVLTGYKIVPAPVVATPARPAPVAATVPTVRLARAKARADAAVDPRWARRTAEAAGIPLPAMTAYARASVLAPSAVPDRLDHARRHRLGGVPARHHR